MKTRRRQRRQKGSGPGCSKCAKVSLSSQKTPDELYEDWKIKNKTIVDEYQKLSLAQVTLIGDLELWELKHIQKQK